MSIEKEASRPTNKALNGGTVSPLTAVDVLLGETLTTAEVATVLNVSKATVEELRREGRLAYVKVTAQKRLYRLVDIRAFLERSVIQSVETE